MLRIAKDLVRTFEQSVQDTLRNGSNPANDAFFHSVPPSLALRDPAAPTGSLYGLRVVWRDDLQLQFEPFFDFIVGLDGLALPTVAPTAASGPRCVDYGALARALDARVGSCVRFQVWSGKGGTLRDEHVTLRPLRPQGAGGPEELQEVALTEGGSGTGGSGAAGSGAPESAKGVFEPLGIKVQWTPLVAATYTYHVLQLTVRDGAAHVAGLVPEEDYIIGCQEGLLATGGETLLQDVVRSRANGRLELYVYNKREDCVRAVEVRIGPDGRLGCGVGYGFLHRVPSARGSRGAESRDNESRDGLSRGDESRDGLSRDPAPMSGAAFVPAAHAPAHAAKAHAAKAHVRRVDATMQSYFNEGKDAAPRAALAPGSADVPPPTVARSPDAIQDDAA